MDCGLPGSSVHGDSPGKNTGVGCHFLLQGIFPTQGLNPGLPNCRQMLYHLSHQGRPLMEPCIGGRIAIHLRHRVSPFIWIWHSSIEEQNSPLLGTSLVVQWLRLHAPNAGGLGFDPWSGK